MEPAVSVIMPWRNTPLPVTAAAIGTVIAQNYAGAVELVISDDGSAPSASASLAELLDDLDHGDVQITVIRSDQSRGISAARNAACAAAMGDWFMWLDADDALDPGACSSLVAAAERAQVPLVLPQCAVHSDGATRVHRNDVYIRTSQTAFGTPTDPLTHVVFPVHGALVHRETFTKTRGFDVAFPYAELTEWFLRTARMITTRSMTTVPDALYHYYRSPDSHSTNRSQLESFRKRALLEHAHRQGLPVRDVSYVSRCGETGAQHYALQMSA